MTQLTEPTFAPSIAMQEPAPTPTETTIIRPKRGWIGIDWPEMVRFRELLFFLVWRDVKVKYKQAVLGFAWAIFIPILSMVVYSVAGGLFGLNRRVDSLGDPKLYPLYIFAGLIPWLFIQRALSDGGNSLLSQQALMTKVYLPRLFLPMASIGSALIDMFIMFMMLIALGGYFHLSAGWSPSWQIVFLPPLFVLTLIAALGLAFTFSAAIVLYRDLRFLIPFITQFGLWFSAVVFPPSVLGQYKNWIALNPISGIISGYRSAILGLPWEWPLLLSSVVFCPIFMIFGLFYFKRVERRFADIA